MNWSESANSHGEAPQNLLVQCGSEQVPKLKSPSTPFVIWQDRIPIAISPLPMELIQRLLLINGKKQISSAQHTQDVVSICSHL